MKKKILKVTTRKHNGDDKYSWAVFIEGNNEPCIGGLSRPEASYYKMKIIKQLKERSETNE